MFAMGLVAGTAVGLITSRKNRSRSRSGARKKSAAKNKRRVDLQKTRKMETKPLVVSQISLARISRKTPVGGVSNGLPIVTQSASTQKTLDRRETLRIPDQPRCLAFSACPSCGLETSDLMMSEHFLNSPSHRLGRKETVGEGDEKISPREEKPLTAEEHSSGVMRNLLSMLAPPRAFGRRHLQQNENRFSDLIQQRRQPGHSPVPKTLSLDN